MNPIDLFRIEQANRIAEYGHDLGFQALSREWLQASMNRQYVYNFDWMGRPIIQYPQDMVVMQELIWRVRPDLIIETGIAHGGSLVLSASMLALLDMSDAIANGEMMDPKKSNRKVVGIDIDIRAHNREAIESHPMSSRIQMIEGSSIDASVIAQVVQASVGYKNIMVCLDSMHTHDHVLAELNAYGPLVSPGSYCVVFDTFVEDMPLNFFQDRPWDVGNNPKTAVHEWLKLNKDYAVDKKLQDKLQITVAPHGFLRRAPFD